ncbi:MAG TPA: dihydroneopterin aldolase [candidate division Zixibacteria bacterium]|nr:dihydroneopterin aldolase [candidate division Zixibacteria bacterium]MDD4918397.1 dihydroneopterin aldolase [candidate division Zixibacteria bacterium]MDM7972419.1 dihydroneopterin aldolase [candidate division Zixibacteria bacterium]HPI33585.1 dihydroneopterin aldolase [candidate division Zixibacteria bacterium]HPM38268.1 dihydroneopterin aldolase [candidate division Zixibacteria bacterium]
MKDVIRIVGMAFYGYHGVTAEERATGRRYEVDCALEVDLAEAGRSDELRDTVDYDEVYTVVRETVEGKSFALLERLAADLAIKLLDRFPVYRVTLHVRKLTPPIAGHIRYIEVEITRYQADPSKLVGDNRSTL